MKAANGIQIDLELSAPMISEDHGPDRKSIRPSHRSRAATVAVYAIPANLASL
jgi:hypothetical protein